MKTILVLTDFFGSSINAANYAVNLAGMFSECRVILYHAFVYAPTYSDERCSISLSVEDFYEENMGRLSALSASLTGRVGSDTSIVCYTDQSPLIDGAAAIARHEHADLVVAGGKARQLAGESLFGSNTLEMLHALPFPLLIVPCDVVFEPVNRAVFACELKEVERIPVGQLRCITHGLNSKLLTINVCKTGPGQDSAVSNSCEREKLQLVMQDLQPEYYQVINSDVREGILRFSIDKQANLVIVVHKKHGFFYDLLRGSVTRKLARGLSAPLLVLREKLIPVV